MGGTNFQAGIDAGGAQLTGCAACMEANASLVENRVVFLTDAQPNAGDDSEQGLLARIKALSADGIYTTIIGGRCGRVVGRAAVAWGVWLWPGWGTGGQLHGLPEGWRYARRHVSRRPGTSLPTPACPGYRRRRLLQAWAWTSTPSWWKASARSGAATTSACTHPVSQPAAGLRLLLACSHRAPFASCAPCVPPSLWGWLLAPLCPLPSLVRVCVPLPVPQASSGGGWWMSLTMP